MKMALRMGVERNGWWAIVLAAALAIVWLPETSLAGATVKPSQIRLLGTTAISPNSSANLTDAQGLFFVPDRQVFVVTLIRVKPLNPGAGNLYVTFLRGAVQERLWAVPNDRPTDLEFPSGWVLEASPATLGILNSAISNGTLGVEVNGYLTRAR
jgi:hypothetical protein